MIQGEDKVTGRKLLAGATPEEWEFPTDPGINLAPGFPVLWRAWAHSHSLEDAQPKAVFGIEDDLEFSLTENCLRDFTSHPFL